MKKTLALLVIALALPIQAGATTYYLNAKAAAANDINAGTSALAPWKTMAHADATLQPGDVLRLYPGSYTFPNPAAAGSSASYITIIGTHPTLDPLTNEPARLLIAIGSTNNEGPSKSFLSIKGVSIASALHFGSGSNVDSVQFCTISPYDLEIAGGDYNVIANNNFKGTRVSIGRQGSDRISSGNRIISNHFDRLGYGLTGLGTEHFWMQGSRNEGGGAGGGGTYVDSTFVYFNRIEFWPGTDALDGNNSGPTLIRTSRQKFRGNRWYYHEEKHTDYVFRLRDSTNTINFDVDTLIAVGSGTDDLFEMSSSGEPLLPHPNVFGVTMDSCYIDFSQANVDPRIMDGMIDWSITYTTILARKYALYADFARGVNVVNHCTLVGDPGSPVVDLRYRTDPVPCWPDTNMTFTNNIVAQWGMAQDHPDPNEATGTRDCGIHYESAVFDSATLMTNQTGLVADHNLYAIFNKAYHNGDRSIMIWNGNRFDSTATGTEIISTPGDSTAANPYGLAYSRWHIEHLSVYGSAQFGRGGPDSVQGRFDPRIGSRSRARGAGTSGSDCGAIAYVSQGLAGIFPTTMTFSASTSSSYSFRISNTGTGTLEVTSVTVPSGRFSVSPSSTSIPAGAYAYFSVSYSSTGSGSNAETVTILTDDPVHAAFYLPVTATSGGFGTTEP